ncbi:MAG TPA: mechanosensitive ion channel domain-containing protein [Cryomorphaceae bacterium]|nr:mechanosensitive ion channel domain-containing protein [Cryomorphaceae bacterium]
MNISERLKSFMTGDSPLEYLIIGALAVLLAFIVHFIVFRILKLIDRKSDAELWDAILTKGYHSTRYFLAVVFLLIAKGIFVDAEGEVEESIKDILRVSLIATFAWVLVSVINITRAVLLTQYEMDVANNLRARKVLTQFRLLGNILKFIVVLVAIGLALLTFETIRQFGVSLLASAGIAGIIVGFAAQKLIATVLAGLQLAITQPIRLDDVVIVEGEWGRVEEMTLTYVVIAIWDKRRLVVPSTYFLDHPFQNWTRVSADLLGTVFIYTDYRFPVDALRSELKKIVEGNSLWDEKVAIVQVTDSKEKTMELRVLVSAKDSPTAWDLRVMVRERLIAFIQSEYPEMLPQSRVELKGENLKYPSSEKEK